MPPPIPTPTPLRRARRTSRRGGRLGLALLGLVAALAPGRVAAQGHPMPAPPSPFHERLERADAVAVVRVREVEPGRLHVERTASLRGDAPPRFAIKRAPSNPPALAAGDRAVVLLRGARPPYVLADPDEDAIRLAHEDAARRWRGALARLLAAGADPEARLRTYVEWIDEGPVSLSEAGLVGAFAVIGEVPALAEATTRERAAAASDPSRPRETRRLSARLAATHPAATAELVDRAARGEGADAGVTLVALQAGSRFAASGLAEAFRRAARHDDAQLRSSAIRAARAVAVHAPRAVEEELARMAAEDPEEGLRQRAARSRQRLGAWAREPQDAGTRAR